MVSAGAAFIYAFFFLELHNLNTFLIMEKRNGNEVGFVTFVYVPIPDLPLKKQKQNTNTKQKKN